MDLYGIPTYDDLRDEWDEMRDEHIFTRAWWMELCDVIHTCLRMIHPWLAVIVWPIVRKHALREKGILNHRK